MKSPRFTPTVEEAFNTFCTVLNGDTAIPVEQRIKSALAEVLAHPNELLHRRAETIAQPIAERHAVTVDEIFGASRARVVTAARDELCAELVACGWSGADVARALGVSRAATGQAAARHRGRATAAAQQTSKAERGGDSGQDSAEPTIRVRECAETAQAGVTSASPSNVSFAGDRPSRTKAAGSGEGAEFRDELPVSGPAALESRGSAPGELHMRARRRA